MAERWLVTGGSGQLGTALRRLAPAGVTLVAPERDEFDLTNLPDLAKFLDRNGIDAIINCGAYTAVDRAESEPELAHAINAVAPGLFGGAAAARGIPVIHVSTDYVFPADGQGPWREDALVNPASVYGQSKAEGEAALRASGARHAIIRTAWVVSADGQNFIKTMLRLGAERDELRVVADQRGCPTHAGDLAAALVRVAHQLSGDPANASGTWHCTNAGDTSWHGLATHVFSEAAKLGMKVPSRVEAIATADYPTPARRPADSRLDCSALARDFGISLRPWQDAVAEIVQTLAQTAAKQEAGT